MNNLTQIKIRFLSCIWNHIEGEIKGKYVFILELIIQLLIIYEMNKNVFIIKFTYSMQN